MCVLEESYLTASEEDAADAELRCDRENTDQLRSCVKLHATCGQALKQLRQIQR